MRKAAGMPEPRVKRLRDARPDYRNAAGKKVPSVTTVIGMIAKPWLVSWANKLGLQDVDSTLYVAEAAGAGTLAHAAIESDLRGDTTIDAALVAEFSEAEKTAARVAWGSYKAWRKLHELEPLLIESQLISERLQVGGTVDLYAKIDGRRAVLDFKTGGRVYESHLVQLAAYRAILEERGYEVDEVRVVLIPREVLTLEPPPEHVLEDTHHALNVFHAARGLYAAHREMERVHRANAKAAREAKAQGLPEVRDELWARFKG